MLYCCHGDDISEEEGGRFYPETRVKTPAKISLLKGLKFFLYQYNDHKTMFANNRGDKYCIKSHISKFLQVVLRYLMKTWKSGVFTPVYRKSYNPTP